MLLQLNGICFSPKESEPICFTFLPGGRLCSPLNLINKDIYDGNQLDKELIYTASTKTQYAGIDAHVAIIKLLRYLKDKYLIPDYKVIFLNLLNPLLSLISRFRLDLESQL